MVNYIKPKQLFVKNYFSDKKTLFIINAKRKKRGEQPIRFRDLIGYDYRDMANIYNDPLFQSQQRNKLADNLIENYGYNNRESAFINHQEIFNDLDDNMLLGIMNGKKVYRKTFNNNVRQWVHDADKLYEQENPVVERMILSFSPEQTDLIRSKDISYEELLERIDDIFREYVKEQGFLLDNINYNITFHTNTVYDKDDDNYEHSHLHAHIDFFQKKELKRRGLLDTKLNDKFKLKVAKSLNHQLGLRGYEDFSVDKNLLTSMGEPLNEMNPELIKTLGNNPAKKYGYIKDKELKLQLREYTQDYMKQAGIIEMVQAQMYDRYMYEKNLERFDNEEELQEVISKCYETTLEKKTTQCCNVIYKMIKDDKYQPNYHYSTLDNTKNEEDDKDDEFNFSGFSNDMNFQRIMFLLKGRKSANYVVEQLFRGWREQQQKSYWNNFMEKGDDI